MCSMIRDYQYTLNFNLLDTVVDLFIISQLILYNSYICKLNVALKIKQIQLSE